MSPDPLAAMAGYSMVYNRLIFADLCRWVSEKTSEEYSTTLDWSGPSHPTEGNLGGGKFRTIVRNGVVLIQAKVWKPFSQGYFWEIPAPWKSRRDNPKDHPRIRHPLAVMLEILTLTEEELADEFGVCDWENKRQTNEEGSE